MPQRPSRDGALIARDVHWDGALIARDVHWDGALIARDVQWDGSLIAPDAHSWQGFLYKLFVQKWKLFGRRIHYTRRAIDLLVFFALLR